MSARIAAVDWGTSRLRIWLLDEAGSVLAERRSDEGMLAARPDGFARILETHLAAMGAPADLPAIICGMAGSRQGWIEAPYVAVPASMQGIFAGAAPIPGLQRDVRILPGVAQRDPEAPDVMRGEETQLLGALALQPQLASGRRVFALPGTHCKWVEVADGRIVRFQTSFIGELYALLRAHSLLAGSSDAPHDAQAFDFGLQRAGEVEDAGGGLAHALFEARSRQLRAGMAPAAADAFLSGLLIGSDVHGMRAMLGAAMDAPVALIATSALAERYAQALQRYGYATQALDGAGCVLAGLRALAE